jgi:mRNA interferase MazF
MIEQGDIITLPFDPARGHEQKGRRPALVVSNNVYNESIEIHTFRK